MSNSGLPRSVAARRVAAMMGGNMTIDEAGHVLDLFKASFSNPLTERDGNILRKDVSIATGLTWYDLRAPALNLFPTVTPLRNSVPRRQRRFPGDAAHWKAVTAISGQASGYAPVAWVPEGQRADSIAYTTTQNSLTYRTIGAEDGITEEARYAAEGFEDEDALVQMRLLLRTYTKEENAILGGNLSLTLSTPSAPTTTPSTTGGTLAAGTTYSVICVALSYEGVQGATVSTAGVIQSKTVTGNDGQTFTVYGGSTPASPASGATTTTGSTSSIAATVPVVNGAQGYAWYLGATAGTEKIAAITPTNYVVLTALPSGSNQLASAVTANTTTNPLAYDGLLTQAFNSSNAYVNAMPTFTGSTSGKLTASGRGSIVEIDTMFASMWNNFRISPTVLYVNAQQLMDITTKVLTNSSGPLLRYDSPAEGEAPYKLTAAGTVSFYFNPFTADGGAMIPVKLHPTLPSGTILGWCERLPPWYISNETPEVAEVLTRQDYYTETWPKTTRKQYYGIYCQSVLAVYAQFGMGVITNIYPG